MIKISVMYPFQADGKFDHDYYRDAHMPLLKDRMGDHCVSYSIDRGICGATPKSDPLFVASCHIYCESSEDFFAGFGPHQKEILADVPNFTTIAPQMQFSYVEAD